MLLFVNGCPRENSRTLELAREVLSRLSGEVTEEALFSGDAPGLDGETLARRVAVLSSGELDHPMLARARRFALADTVVVAAPYWDLLFPARVRGYFEEVTVSGVTFKYGENGIPRGLCRAKKLIYVTTSGGPIVKNLGYDYVCALARGLFGIGETLCISAEGLDIFGADPAAILEEAKKHIPPLSD